MDADQCWQFVQTQIANPLKMMGFCLNKHYIDNYLDKLAKVSNFYHFILEFHVIEDSKNFIPYNSLSNVFLKTYTYFSGDFDSQIIMIIIWIIWLLYRSIQFISCTPTTFTVTGEVRKSKDTIRIFILYSYHTNIKYFCLAWSQCRVLLVLIRLLCIKT